MKLKENELENTKKENEKLKDSIKVITEQKNEIQKAKDQHKCNDNVSPEISKYKEFLLRSQTHCKDLENQMKKTSDAHEKQVNDIKLKEMEEKYGQVMKEKKPMMDKERILLNSLESLKQLDELKTRKNKNDEVIEISEEEQSVGTTSAIFKCDKCGFKSSTERSLEQHTKDKHKETKNSHKTSKNISRIPCDACDHISPNIEEYKIHAEATHKQNDDCVSFNCNECEYKTVSNVSLKKHQEYKHNGKAGLKTRRNDEDRTTIPCDECGKTTQNAEDFLRHIKSHKEGSEKQSNKCDICDKKFMDIGVLIQHIRTTHGSYSASQNTNNTQHNQDIRNIPLKRICTYWNRGYCKLSNNECNFMHINLPACRFGDQCFRIECKFYHEKETQKYPFLGYPNQRTQNYGQPRIFQNEWNPYQTKQNMRPRNPNQTRQNQMYPHQKRHMYNLSHLNMDKFRAGTMY